MNQAWKFRQRLTEYIKGTLSPEEQQEFFEWLASGRFDDLITDEISQQLAQPKSEGVDMHPQRAEEILRKIIQSEHETVQLIPKRKNRYAPWLAAAAIFFVLLCAVWLITEQITAPESSNIMAGVQSIRKQNSSQSPLLIQLADGSNITLQPGSSIEYPKHFLREKREVKLTGEAFFQVAKDAHRPFYVYAGKIVTHVLGTSFNVKQDAQTGNYEVAVRTGRVEVYTQTNEKENRTQNTVSNGVILVPNQKVVFTEKSQQFIASLVEHPQPLIDEEKASPKDTDQPRFEYQAAALGYVLQDLEKTYGIDFELERDALGLCLFTGNISNYDLFTKLDLICAALKASYEIKGTRILIKGRGCINE
jgi:ferric-dicitrate binding protein FerR (iron transport regulator)